MNAEERALYQRAIARWGDILQMLILFEEMAELQKEICKLARAISSDEYHDYDYMAAAEELADVLIMVEQMMVLLDVEADVAQVKARKLQRLARRLGPDTEGAL